MLSTDQMFYIHIGSHVVKIKTKKKKKHILVFDQKELGIIQI